ncbi:MAG TPA: N-acetylmuramoyl-L-alanine amidase, partial [Chitinophagaceae bacterium]|nr:N-acetylmuramoyl-L-alanine amidase [Chitinophagaceae bacterium]
MLTFALYILKVIICSGILYGYYLLALRNKIYHRWNRFYLLAAVVLSLSAPLIKINIWQSANDPKTQVIQILQTVSTGDEFVYEYTKDKSSFHLNASNLSVFIYTVVSGLLLGFLIQTLLKIHRVKKNNRQVIVEGVNFINTNASGTPFSFFKNIFWNDKIDINSPTGKQIFQHEVAHVREKHSHDKIFINIVLIFFWINPVYWLIRKELNIIHEFIADKKALEDSDTSSFAAMILQATYPQEQFNITNNFYYSPLKRRLAMLTKNKDPRVTYITRILVLPFAALVFLAFSLKMRTYNSGTLYKGKIINVVIDAGHGGEDNGAMVDNIKEKDLTLAISKKIKELNKNENINIILSRKEDQYIDVRDRVKFAAINKADLFISIHIDAVKDIQQYSGLHILIPANDNQYLTKSRELGSAMIKSFKNNYALPVGNDLKQRDKGIYLLNGNQSPAALIEAGFLTNPKDLEFLINPANQHLIAKNILDGIEKYAQHLLVAQSNEAIKLSGFDSIPQYYKGKKIKEAYGLQRINKAVIIYEDGSRDTLRTSEAEKLRIIPPPPVMAMEPMITSNDSTVKPKNPNNALIVVNGVVLSRDAKDLNAISPNSIQSISV